MSSVIIVIFGLVIILSLYYSLYIKIQKHLKVLAKYIGWNKDVVLIQRNDSLNSFDM